LHQKWGIGNRASLVSGNGRAGQGGAREWPATDLLRVSCYFRLDGWIDGQKKAHDDYSWLQKFTPRRPKSGWSKMNTRHAERLIESEKMAPAGLKEVEAAKRDGRWKAAYDSFGNATVPIDFLKELAKDNKAKAFFETLNKTNLYSIAYRLQTAKKPETREKRMKAIIEMLARGEKFH
jgi:uncharacterized protein YdeI (YjbR/CyaY-like superfamily)